MLTGLHSMYIQVASGWNEKKVKRLQNEALREEKCHEIEEVERKKQFKKQQKEAEKDQCYRETEKAELRKQLKKQQEDAEREHQPSEKEEAVMKKQTALQKQGTIMERFLKSNNTPTTNKVLSTKTLITNPSRKHDDTISTTTSSMDNVFSQMNVRAKEDLFKLHVAGWLQLNQSNRFSWWGVRRNPKIEVVKESKLRGTSTEADTPRKVANPNEGLTYNKVIHKYDEQNHEKLVDGWKEASLDDNSCHFNDHIALTCSQMFIRKLIQFNNSPRRTYYDTWCKESSVVQPSYHLKKDLSFDCDVVSDEEWEEKEPGENLSDCDKDDEEEQLDKACHSEIDDEDKSECGFILPDGYVSENKGCNWNDMEEEAKSSQYCKRYILSDEFRAPMRQQK